MVQKPWTLLVLLFAAGGFAVPTASHAKDRMLQLRTEAETTDADRSQELIAFSEALDPAQDAYFSADTQTEAKALREACAAMDHDACVLLSEFYERGRGTWPDAALARSIAFVTCEHGHLDACNRFSASEASMIYMYEGPAPSAEVFTKACPDDNGSACARLAVMQADDDTRDALRRLACDLGYGFSCQSIEDWSAYTAGNEAACDAGDPAACSRVSALFLGNTLGPPDIVKAFRLRHLACDQGYAAACLRLANAYRSGRNTEIDPAAAMEFNNRACEGKAAYCWDLAERYLSGDIVDKDEAKGMELARKACLNTYPGHTACKLIGRVDAKTFDVLSPASDPLFDDVSRPFAKRARQGCADGQGTDCHRLSKFLHRLDVPYGLRLALGENLQEKACRLGDKTACTSMALADHKAPDIDALNAACDAGEGKACAFIALLDKDGEAKKRLAQIESACAKNMAVTCRYLGHILSGDSFLRKQYDLSQPPIDRVRALEIYNKGCTLGDGKACFRMSISLAPDGQFRSYAEIPKDAAKAQAYLELACETGGAGCGSLVYDLMGTEGRPADLPRARKYAETSCQRGACLDLENVTRLEQRAALTETHGALQAALQERYDDFDDFYRAYARRARRSCKAGDMDGCLRLAEGYDQSDNDFHGLKNQLIHPPWSEALWLHACDNGSAYGCYRLGSHFRHGNGYAEDKAPAYMARACQMGYSSACD